MRAVVVAIVATLILSACGEGFGPSVSKLGATAPTTFMKSYEDGLVTAGLSADDAAFIAKKASSRLAATKSRAGLAAKSTDDWAAIGESTMKGSLGAIGSSEHFATAEEKKLALEAVTTAHFKSISTRVSASELPGIVGRIAEVTAVEIDETGLTGADLEDAVRRQATSFISALIASSISPEHHSNVVKTFASGSVRGLGSNPALGSSSSILASALANGTLRAVGGDDGILSDDVKGLIVRELLQGVKTGLDDLPSLAAGDRADFFSDVAGMAQSTLVSVAPTLVSNVADVVAVIQEEMPGVVLPVVPTPTPTPVPTPMPTPDPNATPAPVVGTAVSGSAINCTAHVGASGAQKPKWNVHSNAQCESYCDTVANNFSGSTVSCRVGSEVLQSYAAPRTPVYSSATEAISCVTRITNTSGATDFKPATVVNKAACISYCDTVVPHGGLKVCYGDGVSIKEYWGKGLE